VPRAAPALPPEQLLLCVKEVAVLLGVSARSVWRLVAAGDLPQPIRLGKRLVRWRRVHLEALVANWRADERGGAESTQAWSQR